MPVQHAYTMKAGTRSKLLLVYATTSDLTRGKTRLTRMLPSGSAAYIREGESRANPITMVQGRVGEWAAGALAEVDPELLPGVYQFGAPDEMIAEGSARALLHRMRSVLACGVWLVISDMSSFARHCPGLLKWS